MINYEIITSAVRAFCLSYFSHFASGLEPRHIGARPKGTHFETGAIYTAFCLGSVRTEAISDKYFLTFQSHTHHRISIAQKGLVSSKAVHQNFTTSSTLMPVRLFLES